MFHLALGLVCYNVSSFSFRELEGICNCLLVDFFLCIVAVDAQLYLDPMRIQKSLIPGFKHLMIMMMLSFRLNRITHCILPWGTPCLSEGLKRLIRFGLEIFYLRENYEIGQSAFPSHVMYALHYTILPGCFLNFLLVEKNCWDVQISTSLRGIFNLTIWSRVDLRFLKLHWELVIRLSDSIKKNNLLLIIHSIVLLRQLVSDSGWEFSGLEQFFAALSKGMLVNIFHTSGEPTIYRDIMCWICLPYWGSRHCFHLCLYNGIVCSF